MTGIKYIVVHCSDSPNGRADKRFDSAGAIHQWHKKRNWDGIGYHFVIDENGETANGRPIFPDTKEIWQGAHVRNHNSHSIGICLIGADYFHPEQLETLRREIDYLHSIWPEAEVVGHYQLDPKKTCPNFNVKYWYDTGKVKPQ